MYVQKYEKKVETKLFGKSIKLIEEKNIFFKQRRRRKNFPKSMIK